MVNPLPSLPVADSPTSSMHARVRQSSGARFRRLYLAQPLLIAVRRGHKTITIGECTVTADVGECVVLSGGVHADVANTPDGLGAYEADVVVFAPDLVEAGTTAGSTAFGSLRVGPAIEASLQAAIAALDAADTLPQTVVDHRVAELLVWARAEGLSPIMIENNALPSRVRRIVAADPARDWRVGEIASRLAMSESSLRRHLAAEGTSAGKILADARLSRALDQLQTSRLPITEIALMAGYDSPSRFAARFRARFGLAPREIRGSGGEIARFSTEVDQIGAALPAAE
ncbi:MAG: AraC family transcriptional regulator [Ancalomicrobiaceae bacterium]|nr:AraC family transcriptional regulator [Ancalomicrobiaceae bacterium]